DLNPLCVRVAARNAALNGLEARIRARRLDAFDAVESEGDLVVANIHFEVIRGLLEMETFRTRGWLILSGLMRSQVRQVKDRLHAFGMTIEREWDCQMIWHTLVVRGPGL
ncbi:MAG: 50S ribosomal protein L11 methyltransferase, partial [Thermodesulfobacteriota bacterium]